MHVKVWEPRVCHTVTLSERKKTNNHILTHYVNLRKVVLMKLFSGQE